MSDFSIFKDSKISQIRQLQLVVILKDTASIEHVLKTLASHRIVAAPVISHKDADEDGRQHHGPIWPMTKIPDKVIGFVDIKIIIKRFLDSIKESGIIEMKSMLKKMRSLEERGHEFCKQTIREANLLSKDGGFLDVSQENLSLYQFSDEVLLNNKKREAIGPEINEIVHRVAMIDTTKKIHNIISQSDIVRFLCEKIEEFKHIANKSITELGFEIKKIISVPPEMSAVEALKVINENNIGAVAVVDAKGRLIGNFSAADMRTITPEHFGSLALPVGEFLALEHGVEYVGYAITKDSTTDTKNPNNGDPEDLQKSSSTENIGKVEQAFARNLGERRKKERAPGYDVGQELVVCRSNSTLQNVLKFLEGNHIHRVFVVDDDVKPVGLVTDTDVLRKVVSLVKEVENII